jgi:hypothetical protein
VCDGDDDDDDDDGCQAQRVAAELEVQRQVGRRHAFAGYVWARVGITGSQTCQRRRRGNLSQFLRTVESAGAVPAYESPEFQESIDKGSAMGHD